MVSNAVKGSSGSFLYSVLTKEFGEIRGYFCQTCYPFCRVLASTVSLDAALSTIIMATSNDEAKHAVVPTKEKEEEEIDELPASICETTTEGDNADDGDEEDYFADVGFMFEANQPERFELLTFGPKITVALHAADDTPGAVQSGHYLWPAAATLAAYLVEHCSACRVVSVVELGAGCALASLAALQLWQETLQCLVVTDHDPGTLVRARTNLESTVQQLLWDGGGDGKDDDDDADERLNATINSVVSIPVLFEALEWGDAATVDTIVACQMHDHIVQRPRTSTVAAVDVVLGSDLIYCATVVEPLLQTAALFIGMTGRFWLSQSFRYDQATEAEIDRVCNELGLQRAILVDEDSGASRIQEFSAVFAAAEGPGVE